jgi:predicted cation transporter
MLAIGLSVIFIIVLVGPFLNKKIESNLEAFLFAMGVISATIANAWSAEVLHEGFIAPINITLAVLGAGVLFHYLRRYIDHGMRRILITVPLSVIVCVGIIVLGLLSSRCTAMPK